MPEQKSTQTPQDTQRQTIETIMLLKNTAGIMHSCAELMQQLAAHMIRQAKTYHTTDVLPLFWDDDE